MIDAYLKKIDDLILTADEIVNVEIIRRSVWDTDLEKIAIYRYRIYLSDGSLLELTERLVEERGNLSRSKYRFHWQTREGLLKKRWDNAKHHSEIDTFPHHLHDGDEDNVVPHEEPNGFEILSMTIKSLT
jgi:Family of unknown function (DUF6516)